MPLVEEVGLFSSRCGPIMGCKAPSGDSLTLSLFFLHPVEGSCGFDWAEQ